MLNRKIELLETDYNNILAEIQEKKSEMRQKEVDVQKLMAEIDANRECYAGAVMENERMSMDYCGQWSVISKKLEEKRVRRMRIIGDDITLLQNSQRDIEAKIQQIGENLKPLDIEYNNLIQLLIRTRESIVSVDESILTNKIYEPHSANSLLYHPTMTFSEWIGFYKEKLVTTENNLIEQRSNELNGLFN
jgi:chromosome segregation ATPase